MGNKKQFKNLLDLMPFACILMGETLEIKYMNPVMSDFISVNSEKEISGSSLLNYLSQEDRESFFKFVDSLGESQPAQDWHHYKIVDDKGEEKAILLNGIHNIKPLGEEGVYFLAGMPIFENHMAHLLTETLEEKIGNRFSKSKYDSVIDSATIGITILDKDGVIEDTNQTFAAQIGQEKVAVINQRISDLIDKETVEILEKMIKDIREKEKNLAKETLTISQPGGSHIVLEISLARIKDVKEHLGKLMMITENVTDLQDTQAALLQSEKLALTGRLAASLAHEINNPLQTSLGCLGLAEEMLDDEHDDLRVYIEMAMEELQRSARIVKRLRDLNRQTEISEKTAVNLQEILEGVLILTKNRLYDQSIVPICPYQGPPPYIMASRDQIQQVILNLVMNAIDALPEGGNIYMDIIQTKAPTGYELRIRDTGKGIHPEIMENLFDPFFTTKEEGLGLGLYISKNIIEDHNGSISVDSEPGKGTAFTIWLPGLDIPGTKE
jgi:PAS domain S-box-containing protein